MKLETVKDIIELKKQGYNYREIGNKLLIPSGTASSITSLYNSYMQGKKVSSYRKIFEKLYPKLTLHTFENLPVKQEPNLDEAINILKTAIVNTVAEMVKTEREKYRDYEKQNALLVSENKKLHDTLESIQAESVLGMLKRKFEG